MVNLIMNNMKIFIFFVTVLFCHTVSAQYINGELSYLSPGGSASKMNIGFGLGAEMPVSERLVFTGGFNFYFPGGSNYQTSIDAIDSLTDPSLTLVDVNNTVTYGFLNTGVKYYLVGTHDASFGFYAGAKIGGVRSKLTISLGEYDKGLYATEIPDRQVGRYVSAVISPLVGLEKRLKPCSLYLNAQYNSTIKKYTGELSGLNISSSFGINVGVKFRLGSD